jgi:cysteine desulfuration protein SufE
MSVPDDFYQAMGLAELISPLRLRGMGAIVARVKRQLTARNS